MSEWAREEFVAGGVRGKGCLLLAWCGDGGSRLWDISRLRGREREELVKGGDSGEREGL